MMLVYELFSISYRIGDNLSLAICVVGAILERETRLVGCAVRVLSVCLSKSEFKLDSANVVGTCRTAQGAAAPDPSPDAPVTVLFAAILGAVVADTRSLARFTCDALQLFKTTRALISALDARPQLAVAADITTTVATAAWQVCVVVLFACVARRFEES